MFCKQALPFRVYQRNILLYLGTAVAQCLRCCATNRKVAGSIPAGVIGSFPWHKTFPFALWPFGRLSLEQKWVPGIFPGCKGGRCLRLTTLPPTCATVVKSGNLNFMEHSGPLQTCSGTALPVYTVFPAYFVQQSQLYLPLLSWLALKINFKV